VVAGCGGAAWRDDVQPIGETLQRVCNLRAMMRRVVGSGELRMDAGVIQRGFDDVRLNAHVAKYGRTRAAQVKWMSSGRTAVRLDDLCGAVPIGQRRAAIAFIGTDKNERIGIVRFRTHVPSNAIAYLDSGRTCSCPYLRIGRARLLRLEIYASPACSRNFVPSREREQCEMHRGSTGGC
jgi:hypothetical protein